jgi:hypothetical protein
LGKKENINYVGSPIQHTKGEEGEEKVYYQFNELEGAYGYLPVKDTPYFKTYDVFNAKDIKNMIAEAKSENIYATAKIMCDIPQEIIDLITANGIDVEYDDVDVVAKTRLDLNDTETVSASEIIDKYVDYVNPGDNKKLKEIGSQYVQ